MINAVLEIPRRFAFSEVAHARHYSSIFDTALAYSQHCLCRNDKLRSVRVYIELTLFYSLVRQSIDMFYRILSFEQATYDSLSCT